MKAGKKPTRSQRIFIKGKRLNPENWYVERDTPEMMVLIHRHFDNKKKIIPKGDKYND